MAPSREDGRPHRAPRVPFEEKLHQFALSKYRRRAAASLDSKLLRRCSEARCGRSLRLRASTRIRVRSESLSRSVVWRDEQPAVQLRMPLQPATTLSARDREKFDPQASVRGARKVSQLQDNLASLDLELSAEQLKSLDGASRIEPGFPQSIYDREMVRAIRYGGTWDRLLL